MHEKSLAGALISDGLRGLKGLRLPSVKQGCTHVYYVYPLVIDYGCLNISREKIVDALAAEGVTGLMSGYTNLHRLPMYQRKIAYGKQGFPWISNIYCGQVSYAKGICPVAEELHDKSFIGLQLCLHNYSQYEVDLVVKAFQKVWCNLDKLHQIS